MRQPTPVAELITGAVEGRQREERGKEGGRNSQEEEGACEPRSLSVCCSESEPQTMQVRALTNCHPVLSESARLVGRNDGARAQSLHCR